ncbi:MAG TPA: EF-hand domain-containing protein, partial [Candidatus Poseidoniales archaeon]
LAQAALEGWLPLALMLGTAYAVIPAAAERAIWSSSLSSASLALLFLTVPVVSVRPVDAPILLENVGGILMTFGMLPLLAASINLLQTARSGASQSFSTPAGIAGVLAMFLLPIYAVGAYFTGMETLVGEASLHGLNMSLSHGLFFTVGGLLALSATLGYLPQANGRAAAESGGTSTAVWMVALGGFLASVSTALSSLSVRAVERSVTDEDMVEAALEAMAGFDLVGAFLFYGVALGFMVAASVSVRIGFSPSSSRTTVSSDIHSYALANGSTSIRSLLGRGVGLDTELIIGGEEKAATGSTVIAVRADLHNDEVTEFPESDEAVPEELQMLADYLDETDQDVFSFFRSIDLDDSGSIDARELQNALRSAKIANLPPWDMGRLIAAIDIDGDGQINLPELDITVARLRSASSEEE